VDIEEVLKLNAQLVIIRMSCDLIERCDTIHETELRKFLFPYVRFTANLSCTSRSNRRTMVLRQVIMAWSMLTLACFIVMLAVSAKDKAGNGNSQTSDVLASFGIIGSCLGIIFSFIAFLIGLCDWQITWVIATWTVLGGICLFFTCGALGIWCEQLGTGNNPSLWSVELSFDVISAVLFIILMGLVVALMGGDKKGDKTKDGNK